MPAPRFPIDEVLDGGTLPAAAGGTQIGSSREGRPIRGWVVGRGRRRLSAIGGCHADEPVGPAMLERLVAWLAALPARHPLVAGATWYLVPHVNPDGEARNARWTAATVPVPSSDGLPDRGFELDAYLRHAVREPPGEDVEFGFATRGNAQEVRPENRAVAGFLALGAPLALHASFHGMGFAPGPWFLIEPAWVERSLALREALRERVRSMGYVCYDVDRGGEKGFRRIDEGFSTRPDSRAMAAHFRRLGDLETAGKFRPSSMELARSLGGDPFTMVSEMPLFLLPSPGSPAALELGLPAAGAIGSELRPRLARLLAEAEPASRGGRIERFGIRPMPLLDQMRLQLAFLEAAIALVW